MDWKGNVELRDPESDEREEVIEPEEGGDDAVAKIKKTKAELETCRQEKQEYMDGWQRAKADYVNLLRRNEEAAKAAESSGKIKAVEALLPAFDALERAKEHGDVPEGFMAIVRQMETAFAALGIEAVGVAGEVFDPAIHDAMGQDAARGVEQDGKVSVVLEKGFKMGDTVIRPAKVRVAKAT